MKKKIEALLQDGSLTGNAEYASLYKAHQSAKRAVERAKKEKTAKKETYRDALVNGEKDQDQLLALRTALLQAKYMQRYHSAGLKLNKYLLHRWLESWVKTAEVPHEPKEQGTVKPKAKKAVPEKAAAKASKVPKATGKAPKAAGKKAG